MKKSFFVVIVSLFALTAVSAMAAEGESAAKAAMRKKIEEREKAARGGAAEPSSKLMDMNKATKPQLMTLPGIGAEEADRIIAARPYQAKLQVRYKANIPAAVFYDIVDKIEVVPEKQPVKVKLPPAGEKPKQQEDGPVKDKFKAIKM